MCPRKLSGHEPPTAALAGQHDLAGRLPNIFVDFRRDVRGVQAVLAAFPGPEIQYGLQLASR